LLTKASANFDYMHISQEIHVVYWRYTSWLVIHFSWPQGYHNCTHVAPSKRKEISAYMQLLNQTHVGYTNL